jgi:hypothetical protein
MARIFNSIRHRFLMQHPILTVTETDGTHTDMPSLQDREYLDSSDQCHYRYAVPTGLE